MDNKPFEFNRSPDPEQDQLTKPYRLTHPDYCTIMGDSSVSYTQEGIRFYTGKCNEAGLALPLPAGKEAFWEMINVLNVGETEELVRMLKEDLNSPSAPVRAIAAGYLAGSPNSAPHVDTLLNAKQAQTAASQAGHNVTSLDWHRHQIS